MWVILGFMCPDIEGDSRSYADYKHNQTKALKTHVIDGYTAYGCAQHSPHAHSG